MENLILNLLRTMLLSIDNNVLMKSEQCLEEYRQKDPKGFYEGLFRLLMTSNNNVLISNDYRQLSGMTDLKIFYIYI